MCGYRKSNVVEALSPLSYILVCVCVCQEMAAEVSRALAQRDPNLVLSSAFKLRITQRDLATLQETSWLNDEVRVTSRGRDRTAVPKAVMQVFDA